MALRRRTALASRERRRDRRRKRITRMRPVGKKLSGRGWVGRLQGESAARGRHASLQRRPANP
jgi:hypothetical protein